MSIDPHIQDKIDRIENAGYDCSPDVSVTIHCGCGYQGTPAATVPYDEIGELEYDRPMHVCAGCGDA